MILYAIPSHQCNLKCPHCHLKDSPEEYNRNLFIKELNNFDGQIVMFGGEPTFHRDRMFDIVNANRKDGKNRINSIATNLIILDEELLEFYREIHFVSTSWNLTRFSSSQYTKWLENCNVIANEPNIHCAIIITMTEDLIDYDVEKFLFTVDQWNDKAIKYIKFEHCIGDNRDGYFEQCDEWLCKLYRRWRSPIKVETFDAVSSWYHDCRDTYTLQPNGIMVNSCPNGLYVKPKVPSECLMCDQAGKCRPCRLLPQCSFPLKLQKIIESEV